MCICNESFKDFNSKNYNNNNINVKYSKNHVFGDVIFVCYKKTFFYLIL